MYVNKKKKKKNSHTCTLYSRSRLHMVCGSVGGGTNLYRGGFLGEVTWLYTGNCDDNFIYIKNNIYDIDIY